MSLELQIFVAFCKETMFSFQPKFANWFQFSFHDWKRENSSIVIWIVMICSLICWLVLTLGLLLSGWDDFSNYVHLPILSLIAQLDFYLIDKALSMLIDEL